jgi:prolyl-tRNA editing enzyme YbaK/EbsC (Cys-tRNA(Pro) deacylase)
VNGETQEQEIARLKRESRQLADAIADAHELILAMGGARSNHVNLWGERLMERLRPALDLATLVRSRR